MILVNMIKKKKKTARDYQISQWGFKVSLYINMSYPIYQNIWSFSESQKSFLPFSCANLLASRKVTSLSASRSFLLPQRMMTMFGLANVLASVSHFVKALYVSRLGRKEKELEWNSEITRSNMMTAWIQISIIHKSLSQSFLAFLLSY